MVIEREEWPILSYAKVGRFEYARLSFYQNGNLEYAQLLSRD